MPRIRQYEEKYAMEDFLAEINAQCARYGYRSQKSLGEAIGICQGTVCNYLHRPQSIPLGILRAMVKLLRPDPVIMLTTLGYTTKDIKQLKERWR